MNDHEVLPVRLAEQILNMVIRMRRPGDVGIRLHEPSLPGAPSATPSSLHRALRSPEQSADMLGYRVVYQNEREEVDIAPDPSSFPGLAFLRVPGDKQVKNRLHIDLNPESPADQEAEVRRLQTLGRPGSTSARGTPSGS